MSIFYGKCEPKSGYFKPIGGGNVKKCDENCKECVDTATTCTACVEN